MKVLLVGGSGYVGSMVMPHLKSGLTIRVLDPAPPKDGSVDYVSGSATDPRPFAARWRGWRASSTWSSAGPRTAGTPRPTST